VSRFLAARTPVLLAAVLASACGGGEPKVQPRLVVLYATCTLNKSFLGVHGDVRFTPNLDAFAAESVVFQRHQTESGQSGISFASIFSGTQAWVHGIYDHPNSLSDDLYLVTEAFRDAGYDPWFWSGHGMASYALNYGQGVAPDHVFDGNAPPNKREKLWSFLQPENPLMQTLLERLEEDPDYKAFVLCNFTVTHGKYHRQAPEQHYGEFLEHYPDVARGLTLRDLEAAWEIYDRRYEEDGMQRELRMDLQWGYASAVERIGATPEQMEAFQRAIEVTYAADVAFLDRMFGRTIETLESHGLYDQSLIAFTADHGETLWREGTLFKWTHGLQLAPEVLEVPWFLRSPPHGLRPGPYASLTSSTDVYPTLAGLCGIDLEGRGVLGTDLSRALLGETAPPKLPVFSHTTKIGAHMKDDFARWSETRKYFATDDVDRIWVQVREEDMVYQWRNLGDDRWGARVFDLSSDPFEARDLYDEGSPEHAKRVEAVREYKRLLESRFGRASTDAPADSLWMLQQLGYAEGGSDDE